MITDNISTHSLKDITDQVISVNKFIGGIPSTVSYLKPAHRRDDHYLFIFQKRGKSKIVVDFRDVELSGSSVLSILPGQVHYGVSVCDDTEAWLITIDINFISDDYRAIFDHHYFQCKPLILPDLECVSLDKCLQLMADINENHDALSFMPQVMHSLIGACVGIFASAYQQIEKEEDATLRTQILTREFKRLLLKHFKTYKSTSDFASELNISAAYLNEAVKLTTGYTVGFWIQQAVMMEAKRLLYATDNTVKQIAYMLGFTDHAYFTRYFSSAHGQSPSSFRANYRK
ncbi:AraC family transcriptional regulator [Pedobacter sp. SG908]|uniref:helix-turn-helix domain-containing protein n=1 Tax=Pedobacter sp. SG908 TaxID=2587135 RepID=UPI00141DC6E6|nr:AraC family transcriptional regulator [Pedobacter sp. SG908]NII83248.1 AraC-like DNA-binding protein [Pedobacter sp. SG908]